MKYPISKTIEQYADIYGFTLFKDGLFVYAAVRGVNRISVFYGG